MTLSDNAIKVLEKRYLARDVDNKLIETPEVMFRRVAHAVAAADAGLASEAKLGEIEEEFYDLMMNLEFLPNSPTLMNAGRPLGQLSACFVLPVGDSMEEIFDSVKNAALIHKSGGGTGFSFSRLRQKGATVNSTGGVASGPVSFMKVFNAATEAVKQGGTRRGANMGILRVDHPDILEFIACKQDNADITNFNISVGLTETFMNAVETGADYDLIDPKNKKPIRQLSARAVFETMVKSAWKNGEPGMIFLDRLNRFNVTPALGEIESTNPCVTGDTWVLTEEGPCQVCDILGKQIKIALHGVFYPSAPEGFFKTGNKEALQISTDRGYSLKVTSDHRIRTVSGMIQSEREEAWTPAGDLKPGDRIVLSANRGISWTGKGTREEGFRQGLISGNQKMGCEQEQTSSEYHAGFLRGLFDIDGVIAGTAEKGVSVRIWKHDKSILAVSQGMLHRLGIASSIYANRKPAGVKNLHDGRGGTSRYPAAVGYELVISGDNLQIFSERIGFGATDRQKQLESLLSRSQGALNHESFVATVTGIRSIGTEDVHDVQIPQMNAFDANGIMVHNCGEQPLLPYEACNLGSINLSLLVKRTAKKTGVDYPRLTRIVRKAVHFLDNVIDVNKYPLPDIGKMTRGTRKIGLGVMGWADMLLQLGIPYDSMEAETLARKVMGHIQDTSHAASVKLAEEKGVFPYWEDSIYKDQGLRLRNATTTTIAPTGTLSMLAGVSSGVEPMFAIAYIKNVMDRTELFETNPYFRKAAEEGGFYSDELMKRVVETGTLHGMEEVPEAIRRVYVTAHDISPEWHVRMQAAFQEFTDNAVSKTVNLSHEATENDVREVFMQAYRTGCKGVTIYRDGSRGLQVLNIGSVNEERKADGADKAADETIPGVIVQPGTAGQADDKSTVPGYGHIAPRPRPEITTGFTEKVKIGCGNLYITVNYDENGICEVFTNTGRAGGCPSQSEATSRLVSIALRSGMDEKAIVEQLKGIRCPSTIRQKGLKVLSCPDAIGRLIEKVSNHRNGNGSVHTEISAPAAQRFIRPMPNLVRPETEEGSPGKTGSAGLTAATASANAADFAWGSMAGTSARFAVMEEEEEVLQGNNSHDCPECGEVMEHEGGCKICRSCGYSKCG